MFNIDSCFYFIALSLSCFYIVYGLCPCPDLVINIKSCLSGLVLLSRTGITLLRSCIIRVISCDGVRRVGWMISYYIDLARYSCVILFISYDDMRRVRKMTSHAIAITRSLRKLFSELLDIYFGTVLVIILNGCSHNALVKKKLSSSNCHIGTIYRLLMV